jgi:hypothetical protein
MYIDRDTIRDLLWVILIILIVLAVFAGLVYGISYLNKFSCDAKTIQIGFPHRWSFWGNCQIEVNPGKWIPLDSYYFKQP